VVSEEEQVMQVKVKLSGNITNEPRVQSIGTKGTALMELNVAVNHDRKNRDTGEYEKTGDTTWVLIKLWGAAAEEAQDEDTYHKSDLIEFDGTIVEKHYKLSNGTEGRKLESDWVESLKVLYSKAIAGVYGSGPEDDSGFYGSGDEPGF
jgi:single-stranded DNA-binding protein